MTANAFIAPLSFSQFNLWIGEQFKQQHNTYHITVAHKIEGSMNIDILQKSLNSIVDRHEILRSSIRLQDGAPVLFVKSTQQVRICVDDIANSISWENEKAIDTLIQNEERTEIDLANGPLFRLRVFKFSECTFLLVLTIHHIICDGWSLSIFMRELFYFYNQYITGNRADLPALPIQYPDYTSWENQRFQGIDLHKDIIFWRERLKDIPLYLQLPTDFPRPMTQGNNGGVEYFEFSADLSNRIRGLSRQEGTSDFMTLTAAFAVLLSKYSQQTDIVIGTTTANRNEVELESLIGFFVDFVSLRFDCKSNVPFNIFLAKVRDDAIESFMHNSVPFAKLLDFLDVKRDPTIAPIFQVMFILKNTPKQYEDPIGFNLRPVKHNTTSTKYDLCVEILESEEVITGLFQYRCDLFKAETVRRWIDMYMEILEAVTKDVHQLISDINFQNAYHRQLLDRRNYKVTTKESTDTVIELFSGVAGRMPKETAIILGDRKVTYEELDAVSNAFASFLQHTVSVTPGDIIAVKMNRSENMIIAILAVLKMGAAYLPLDPEYPLGTTNRMYNNSGAGFLITEKEFSAFTSRRYEFSTETFPLRRSASDIFAVLYTTGSTDIPKGVPLSNANVLNRFEWMWRDYPFNEDETCASKTSFSFVDHIWELFGPLLKGIPVVFFDKMTLINTPLFISKLSDHRVTRIVLVPSLLREIVSQAELCQNSLQHLTQWTSSGEVLDVALSKRFYELFPRARLLNIYGSTEITADVTCCDTSLLSSGFGDSVPLGKEIDNVRIYILDEENKEVPFGAIGEICVSGKCVATGYLNSEMLTMQRFQQTEFGERIYKTGDLGRWLGDGNLEFCGRNDNQVKILGNRVDMTEIENQLMHLQGIELAIVTSYVNDVGNRGLVAYIKTDVLHDGDAIRMKLSERLPGYMVPSRFALLKIFPLFPNGKVDRKKLSATQVVTEVEYVAPSTELQSKLVKLWSDVLKVPVDKIGIISNFFELGGDSIRLLQLIAAFNNEFDRQLSVITAFKYVNIKAQISFLLDSDYEQVNSEAMAIEARDVLEATINTLAVSNSATSDLQC